MIKILLVDDDPAKVMAIQECLESTFSRAIKFDFVKSSMSAKERLREEYFDVLILDLNLPVRDLGNPEPEEGVNLLRDICRSGTLLIQPRSIVGLTSFGDLFNKHKGEFDVNVFSLIAYSSSGKDWEEKLKNKINFVIKSERGRDVFVSIKDFYRKHDILFNILGFVLTLLGIGLALFPK